LFNDDTKWSTKIDVITAAWIDEFITIVFNKDRFRTPAAALKEMCIGECPRAV